MRAYIDSTRESDAHALPDVEVWGPEPGAQCERCGTVYLEAADERLCDCGEPLEDLGRGYWYAYGFPGCMPDSDPCGPFPTREAAMIAAREAAGFCPHGFAEDDHCLDCDGAPDSEGC